jgi:hypothetical protein
VKIVRPRQHHQHCEHRLVFERVGSGGAGFSFPCDEAGHVNQPTLPPAARDNYRACLEGRGCIVCQGVVETEHSWWEPAVGACEGCERAVVLAGFTNTCDCGADYNGSGQLLAPREQWGEETGESVADILGVDAASVDDLLV